MKVCLPLFGTQPEYMLVLQLQEGDAFAYEYNKGSTKKGRKG